MIIGLEVLEKPRDALNMKHNPVLIIGPSNENLDRLLNILYEVECHPVIRNRVDRLPRIIQRRMFTFAAVLGGQGSVDAIEAVLTIRDYRSELPVIVIDPKPNEKIRRILDEVAHVTYLPFREKDIVETIRRKGAPKHRNHTKEETP